MPLRNDLLNPISPEKPSGDNLRYDPVYDKIKEARREEDESEGAYKGERKLADWPLVIRLISESLATKTKDLQMVAWLAEAMLKREGVKGFGEVLDLARGFLETFWDTLYPEIEDGDLEARAASLQWIGDSETMVKAVRLTSITSGGLNVIQWRESRTIATEEDASNSYAVKEQRDDALKRGKIPPEQADKDFASTTKQFFATREKEFDATLESLKQLGKLCDEKFSDLGDESPSLLTIQKELEDVRGVVHGFLVKKRETDPDPVEPAPKTTPQPGVSDGGGTAVAPARVVVADLTSWEGAAAQVVATAKYMRQQNPYNPAPFLMLRGLRWGELRADGQIDPRKLAAAPSDLRQNLKRQALSGEWKQALETAETAMGLECGRGWLDIQRYVVAACDELGGYYQPVRRAVIAELKALLQDFPRLLEMSLLDDLPTANADTVAWIDQCVLARSPDDPPVLDGIGSLSPQVFELARQAVRNGRPEAAVELLAREISRDPSGRGRFQRRIQAAQLCMSSGNEGIALPILRDAAAEIEQKKLEEWEAPETLAYPLILYYRCLVRTEDPVEDRDKLFSWICRLDPIEAMKLEK